MKRTVDISKTLGAFSFDVARLNLLAADMAEVFSGLHVELSIKILLKGEHLEFSDIEELESHISQLPPAIQFELSWWDHDGSRRCSVRMGWSAACVYVSSPSDAWCAAAVAVVEKHTFANRRWYRLLRSWHFGLAALILGLVLPRLVAIRSPDAVIGWGAGTSWLVLILLCWVLFFGFERLFPQRTLLLRSHENWLRHYLPELTLALSVAALLVSILGLFVQK